MIPSYIRTINIILLNLFKTLLGEGVSGYCYLSGGYSANELNLTYRHEPESLLLPDETVTTNENETDHSRRRRDVNYVVPTEITERGGKQRKIVTLDCDKGTAKCVRIVCQIKNLKQGNAAHVDVKSRIWNSTLTEDYSEVDWVAIRSKMEVSITDTTFNISSESISHFSAETIAYPEIVSKDGVKWWIIGGAFLIGLVLLILLIVILKKCGFFERKRISNDPTLSGNLQKKGESETLLENK